MKENSDQPFQHWENEEPGGGEDIAAELWRIWLREIMPNFKAEEKFLREFGERLGYPKEYIDQVSRDHKIMAELILEGGKKNLRSFSNILANYMRYKQESFRARLNKSLDKDEFDPKPNSTHVSKFQPCTG